MTPLQQRCRHPRVSRTKLPVPVASEVCIEAGRFERGTAGLLGLQLRAYFQGPAGFATVDRCGLCGVAICGFCWRESRKGQISAS